MTVFLLFFSCTKEKVIFDSIANENYDLPLVFRLNGKDCLYNKSTNTLKYSITSDGLSSFSPYTEFEKHSTLFIDGREISNHALNDFSQLTINKDYELTFITNEKQNVMKLRFTPLPLAQLVTFDRIKDEPKILAKITVNYPEVNIPSTTTFIGIEKRGASTSGFDKKSYGFKILNDKNIDSEGILSFFGLKENNKWILDAMYNDQSRMRNKTSFEIWDSFSDSDNNHALQSNFVELYNNHQSLGLYCFNENFTQLFFDLNSQSLLYKSNSIGKEAGAAAFFSILPHKSPKGGFWGDWEQIYPNPLEREEWSELEAMSRLIVEGSDDEFVNNIEEYIDFENLIDYYIFINICQAFDNKAKNYFFLRKNVQDKFVMIPWDIDASWGQSYDGTKIGWDEIIENNLFLRLIALNPNNFKNQLKNRWQELKMNQISPSILQDKFAKNFQELNSSDIEEVENQCWQLHLDFVAEQSYINSFIEYRINLIDNHISDL